MKSGAACRRCTAAGARRPWRGRGFVLVVALFLTLIFLVMGLSFLGRKALQYKGAILLRYSNQARAIAEAGIEDALVKLERDFRFPPPGDEEQRQFTYSESFTDIDGSTVLGSYTVTIDSTWKAPPYGVLRITSTGIAGEPDSPDAVRTLVAELDVAPDAARTLPFPIDPADYEALKTAGQHNPRYWKVSAWEDQGNL